MASEEEKYVAGFGRDESEINDNYRLLKEQNYTALRDKQIQLENAKNNALKYTQNQLASQGLGSQGYGSSTNAGIYNNYMNAFANEGHTIAEQNTALDIQKQQEINQLREKNLNGLYTDLEYAMENTDDINKVNQYLANMGFGTANEDGSFTFASAKPDNISQSEWNSLKYRYSIMSENFNENAEKEAETNDAFSRYEFLDNKQDVYDTDYINGNGETGRIWWDFREEVDRMFEFAKADEIKDGGVLELRSRNHGSVYYEYNKKDGFKLISRSKYKNSDNRYKIEWWDQHKLKQN